MDGGRAGVALPQVLALSGACRTPPAQYLSNLHHFHGNTCIDGCPFYDLCVLPSSELQLLCKHCTNLQELAVTAHHGSIAPEGDDDQVPEYCVTVAAIGSLTSLQQLTCLKFTPRDDFELVALVTACCVLESHSLQELHMSESTELKVTPGAWLQLSQLRQLRQLTLKLTFRGTFEYYSRAAEAALLVSALSGSKNVSLQLPIGGGDLSGVITEAVAAVLEAGLPAAVFDFSTHNWSY
jgi:hypothetical protein